MMIGSNPLHCKSNYLVSSQLPITSIDSLQSCFAYCLVCILHINAGMTSTARYCMCLVEPFPHSWRWSTCRFHGYHYRAGLHLLLCATIVKVWPRSRYVCHRVYGSMSTRLSWNCDGPLVLRGRRGQATFWSQRPCSCCKNRKSVVTWCLSPCRRRPEHPRSTQHADDWTW